MSKVLMPVLFLITAIGLFFTYLSPAYDVLLASQAQEARLDESIKQSEALLATHDDLLRKYNSIPAEDIKRLVQLLPNDVDTVRLIMDIDALTTKHSLSVRSFKVPNINARAVKNTTQTAEEEKPVGEAILTIECDGDYFDFKELLNDIEISLSLVDVVGLKIKVADLTLPDAVDTTVFTLELQTYWLK